jgi:hypothetical protein
MMLIIGDGINETCIGSILHHSSLNSSWLKKLFKCNLVEYECFEHTTPYMFWRSYDVIKNKHYLFQFWNQFIDSWEF